MTLLIRVLGASVALMGVMHLIFGEAPTRLFQHWPEWLPGRPLWAHAAGLGLAVCGTLLVMRRRERSAALGATAIVMLAVLLLHLPAAVPSGTLGGAWLGFVKFLALAAGISLVAGVDSRFARWSLAAFMVFSALMHLRFTSFVIALMPEWMPWRPFWAQFTALTLAAGGIGLLVPQVAPLAGRLSGAMFFGFFLLVHVPRTITDPAVATGWLELGESMAYCIVALMLAEEQMHAEGRARDSH